MAGKPEYDLVIRMNDGSDATLSYYKELKLIMLHTKHMNAQWGEWDFVPTIQVCGEHHFMLGLQTHLGKRYPDVHTSNYQSFFISMENYEQVVKFFWRMGFPMDRCVVVGVEDYKRMSEASKH